MLHCRLEELSNVEQNHLRSQYSSCIHYITYYFIRRHYSPPPLLRPPPLPQILPHAASPRIPLCLIVSSMPDIHPSSVRVKLAGRGGHEPVDLLIIEAYDGLLVDILQTPKKKMQE